LLRQLQEPLADHIRGLARDDDLAADVLQDVLLIICRRLGTVRQTEWVRAWAYRVATREALHAVRRARRHTGESMDDMADIPDLSHEESANADDELLAALPARLDALPPKTQIVLRLHYLQSLTQQEIAEALEIPLGTVKSRLAYGLMCLRQIWVP
jgi:RNA polymerase sigma-70 factor, ECF subfamily